MVLWGRAVVGSGDLPWQKMRIVSHSKDLIWILPLMERMTGIKTRQIGTGMYKWWVWWIIHLVAKYGPLHYQYGRYSKADTNNKEKKAELTERRHKSNRFRINMARANRPSSKGFQPLYQSQCWGYYIPRTSDDRLCSTWRILAQYWHW